MCSYICSLLNTIPAISTRRRKGSMDNPLCLIGGMPWSGPGLASRSARRNTVLMIARTSSKLSGFSTQESAPRLSISAWDKLQGKASAAKIAEDRKRFLQLFLKMILLPLNQDPAVKMLYYVILKFQTQFARLEPPWYSKNSLKEVQTRV